MRTSSTLDLTRNHILAAAMAAGCVVSTSAVADWSDVPVSDSVWQALAEDGDAGEEPAEYVYVAPEESDTDDVFDLDRATTDREHAIAELRRWKDLAADWDGEGARAPIQRSLDDALTFACLLDQQSKPEPMLHASGRAGLYWKEEDFYADLEFRGDGRVAYYIERANDRHKGVAQFEGKSLPQVFTALLAPISAA